MYAAGPSQSQDFIDQEKEDYLLGKKKIGSTTFKAAEEDDASAVAALPTVSSMYGPSANTTRDFQSKVRDDPLMAFKRQEQASLQAVLKNPLKVSKLKDGKKAKKSKRNKSRSRSPVDRRDSRDYRDKPRERSRDHYSRDDRVDHKRSSRSYYEERSRSPRPSYKVDHERV
jgi:Pre-mRNA splicing factor